MKKMILYALSTALTVNATAQKVKFANVPAAVKTAFTKTYPGAVAKWDKEDGDYEASFTQNSTAVSVLYNASGTVKETENEIPVAQLPATVTDYVKKNRPGKTIKAASKITDEKGTVTYEAEVAGKDLLFTEAGALIKEVKE